MVGDGEMYKYVKKHAGPNVEVRQRLSFPELKEAYATCRALVFTPEEDFGIVPVEANASGRPVIAYGRGGARDSIIEGQTGLFYNDHTADGLVDAIKRFEAWETSFDPAAALANAQRFSPERFAREFQAALAYFHGREMVT